MKKIFIGVGVIILLAVVGRLGWAYYQVTNKKNTVVELPFVSVANDNDMNQEQEVEYYKQKTEGLYTSSAMGASPLPVIFSAVLHAGSLNSAIDFGDNSKIEEISGRLGGNYYKVSHTYFSPGVFVAKLYRHGVPSGYCKNITEEFAKSISCGELIGTATINVSPSDYNSPNITVVLGGGNLIRIGDTQTISWSTKNIPGDSKINLELVGALSGTPVNLSSGFRPPSGDIYFSEKEIGSYEWVLKNTWKCYASECAGTISPPVGSYKIRASVVRIVNPGYVRTLITAADSGVFKVIE